jgi:hypothetical protein
MLHFTHLLILWHVRDASLRYRGSVYLTLIISYLRLESVTKSVTNCWGSVSFWVDLIFFASAIQGFFNKLKGCKTLAGI